MQANCAKQKVIDCKKNEKQSIVNRTTVIRCSAKKGRPRCKQMPGTKRTNENRQVTGNDALVRESHTKRMEGLLCTMHTVHVRIYDADADGRRERRRIRSSRLSTRSSAIPAMKTQTNDSAFRPHTRIYNEKMGCAVASEGVAALVDVTCNTCSKQHNVRVLKIAHVALAVSGVVRSLAFLSYSTVRHLTGLQLFHYFELIKIIFWSIRNNYLNKVKMSQSTEETKHQKIVKQIEVSTPKHTHMCFWPILARNPTKSLTSFLYEIDQQTNPDSFFFPHCLSLPFFDTSIYASITLVISIWVVTTSWKISWAKKMVGWRSTFCWLSIGWRVWPSLRQTLWRPFKKSKVIKSNWIKMRPKFVDRLLCRCTMKSIRNCSNCERFIWKDSRKKPLWIRSPNIALNLVNWKAFKCVDSRTSNSKYASIYSFDFKSISHFYFFHKRLNF